MRYTKRSGVFGAGSFRVRYTRKTAAVPAWAYICGQQLLTA